MGWTRVQAGDSGPEHGGRRGTRTAHEVRESIGRWFALLFVPWVILLLVVAAMLAPNILLAGCVIGVGLAVTASVWIAGLHPVLDQVDRLTEERHGLREAYDRARLDSLRDGLTGLGNHRAFQEELDSQIAATRSGEPGFALMYVDVDNLKKTNDAQGHAAGDDLLRATSRIIASNMRRHDRGFRIGGDEFAVVLADCGPDEAAAIGRRILASALDGGAGTVGVAPFSVTVGVSAYPEPATDRQQLLHQADAALYWGKRHGRTDVQMFDPSRHGMAEDHRPTDELAAAVARVAAGRLLVPVFQPIYNLSTGEVAGYEGLIRPKPDAGFANASALFVAAESTGRTVELDLASLETVLAGALRLDARQYLSVNLSPRSLEAEAFSPFEVLALARRHGIDPTRLVVELTERESVEDLDRLRGAMAALRRHGVRMAADDVGAGNAGLRMLSEFTFDIMKIDLSLVQAGAARDSADAVLHALRDLAKRRSQTIVAEGIETPEQLEVVLSLGLDTGQGYLLGRPGPGFTAARLDLLPLLTRYEYRGGVPAPQTG